MRRVVSYGGPSGVPGSQRLKHKLSLTPGLHLISSNSIEEEGFLAAVVVPQDERVIHRTSRATHNFYATASILKKVAKREPWVTRKDPFAPLVKDRTIFGEPLEFEKDCNAGGSSFVVEDLDQMIKSATRVDDNDEQEGAVDPAPGSALIISSNNTQVLREAGLENTASTACSSGHLTGTTSSNAFDGNSVHQHSDVMELETVSDMGKTSADFSGCDTSAQYSAVGSPINYEKTHQSEVSACGGTRLTGLSDDQKCELGQFRTSVAVEGDLEGAGPNLETKQLSIPHVQADIFSITSAPVTRQDTQTFRGTMCDANPVVDVDIFSVIKQDLLETSAAVQDSADDAVSVQCKIIAAVKIQRYCRGWLQKKQFKQVKERVVFLQSLARMSQPLRQYQRVLKAVIVLQKNRRAVQGVRFAKDLKIERAVREQHNIENAAITVQKHWRAIQSRCVVKYLKKEQAARAQQRKDHAAVVMQKHWRALQCRRSVGHLKMEHLVREHQRRDHAAVVLQKYWRAEQSKRLVKHLKLEQAFKEKTALENAAVVLQKHWQARQSRFLVNGLKMELVLREQQRIVHAAVVLQKYWRAGQSRLLVKQLKMEQAFREKRRFDKAAIVLQKHWLARQCRLLVNYLKMEQAVKEQQRIFHAAVVLQRHWRAERSRRFVKQLKLEQAFKEQETVNKAATVLQKHWRARQCRLLVNHLKMEQVGKEQQSIFHAAVVLQKHCRAEQSRRLFKQLKLERAFREQERVDKAAIMLQKHWRAQQSRLLVNHLKMEQVTREKQRVDHAVVVMQKSWRARQTRHLAKNLKLEQACREQEKVRKAAIVLQKHWQARQSRLLVNRLKMEQVGREQKRIDHAVVVLQKSLRAQQSRRLIKHLKMEQVAREQKTAANAAIVLQKHWRGQQSRLLGRLLGNHRQVKQAAKEEAALCIQARRRSDVSRFKLKIWHLAALTIQKAWKQYSLSRRTVSAVLIQVAFRSYSDRKRKIQAATVLQAYVHGFAGQHRPGQVPKPAGLALQPDHSGNEMFAEAGAVATAETAFSSASHQHTRDASGCVVNGEDSLESCSSAFFDQHDVHVQTADQMYNSPDSLQRLDCAHTSPAEKHESGSSPGLDGEFPVITVEELHAQKTGRREDWNYVAVDHLEECLDTCLAVLRPLPPTLSMSHVTQRCLPILDVPEEARLLGAIDQPAESTKIVDTRSAPQELSTSTCQQVPNALLDFGEAGGDPLVPVWDADATGVHLDQVTSQVGSGNSSGPQEVAGTHKTESPVQGKSLRKQTLKQNEQRLKQFAQVFLLQRHIALQQQRAQAAPPFPPPMQSGSELPSHMVASSLRDDNNDFCLNNDRGQVVVQNTSTHTDANPSEVAGGPQEEHHLICEVVDPDDQPTVREQPPGSENSRVSTEVVTERSRPDVVVDMVLLLRQIEEEYGTPSEPDFETERSTWFSSRCGDIEEGIPLLDRNVGPVRKHNSVVDFANAVSMKRISIPDVNAMLLVVIAMVVYTRTLCHGVFFGTRQTHRRT